MTTPSTVQTATHVPPPPAARPVRGPGRLMLVALVTMGCVSLAGFAAWWFRPEHVQEPWLFAALSLALWYGIARMCLGWVAYLHVTTPEHVEAPEGLSVAVFVTSSPGEPLAMFRRTLAALTRLRHPHVTYLLDDTRDPAFAELAREMGAIHLEILDEPGAKAGKINAALQRTEEEFILVLDPDHVPHPDLLHRVLGHFGDDDVGFVQICQGYYNQSRSFVARAAAEQTYGFYGPTLMGLHGAGAAVAIGANCTFRRAALNSISGHGVGLAEDLITAIRLHAAGWRSVYVPEVLSRGLVPEDLGSFCKQQLKWSKGLFDVLLHDYPHCFRDLTWKQRFSYLATGSYYLVGLTASIYLTLPLLYLATSRQGAAMDLAGFIQHGAPVAFTGVAIYLFAQRWLCDERRERGLHWRGMVLKIGLWYVYFLGMLLSLFRRPLPYVPTPKEAVRGHFFKLARVPLALMTVSMLIVAWALFERYTERSMARLVFSAEATWVMILFAAINLFHAVGVSLAAWGAAGLPVPSVLPVSRRWDEKSLLSEMGCEE